MRAWMLGLALLVVACGGTSPQDGTVDDHAVTSDDAAVEGTGAVGNNAPHAATPVATTMKSPPAEAGGRPATDATIGDDQVAVSSNAALPADIVAYKERRDECDHFRGEEASDEARAAELEKALTRTCKGTDATLAALRKRYAANAAVVAALADYESDVE